MLNTDFPSLKVLQLTCHVISFSNEYFVGEMIFNYTDPKYNNCKLYYNRRALQGMTIRILE